MRIAFVGKGGSGKSTVSALWISYLLRLQRRVLAIDADLNSHLPLLLGITDLPPSLSGEETASQIKKYLKGQNTRIVDDRSFIKTTPPGTGSQLIRLNPQDWFIQHYTRPLGTTGALAIVGSCIPNDIGVRCYHSNLMICENVVSHLDDEASDIVVLDMVAGVDAFSHTLHAQADMLLFVVEPTRESVDVAKRYQALAENAGVKQELFFIANKMENEEDSTFLASEQICPVASFPLLSSLKRLRQHGTPLLEENDPRLSNVCDAILQHVQTIPTNKQARLERLHRLHERYQQDGYVQSQSLHGLHDQIDPDFHFSS